MIYSKNGLLDKLQPEPLVSIAMCTFNGERYIHDQVKSILEQSWSKLELIVCDDGSSDSTLEIIRNFNDPRIKIYSNPVNLGLVANFFYAISLCTGQYIALSDQDDLWLKDKIQTLLAQIGDNMLVYANSEFVNESGQLTGKKISGIRRMYSGNDNRAFSIPYITPLYGHAMMFDSTLKDELKSFPPGYHDVWIGFVAASNGSVSYFDKVLVHYRQHDHSVTRLTGKKKRSEKDGITPWFASTEDYLVKNSELGVVNSHLAFFRKLNKLYLEKQKPAMAAKLSIFLFRFRAIIFYTKPRLMSRFNLIRKILR